MFKHNKNNTKGFTLIEIVVALGIVIVLSGLAITTLSSISQARMREFAQTLKSEFEITRNFAKTHGGDAEFTLRKVDGGFQIERTGENLTTEERLLKDRNLSVFYKKTGDDEIYSLGVHDAPDVSDKALTMTFSQTQGAIIGPHMLDYITISNGSKNFKLIIKQSTGMMYFDYELEKDGLGQNVVNGNTIFVSKPAFISNGTLSDTIEVEATGSSVQPELSYDSRYIRISGVYRAIDPGSYMITFSLKDPYSTAWDDDTVADKTLIWKIK